MAAMCKKKKKVAQSAVSIAIATAHVLKDCTYDCVY
jgi:hypothetical protein